MIRKRFRVAWLQADGNWRTSGVLRARTPTTRIGQRLIEETSAKLEINFGRGLQEASFQGQRPTTPIYDSCPPPRASISVNAPGHTRIEPTRVGGSTEHPVTKTTVRTHGANPKHQTPTHASTSSCATRAANHIEHYPTDPLHMSLFACCWAIHFGKNSDILSSMPAGLRAFFCFFAG